MNIVFLDFACEIRLRSSVSSRRKLYDLHTHEKEGVCVCVCVCLLLRDGYGDANFMLARERERWWWALPSSLCPSCERERDDFLSMHAPPPLKRCASCRWRGREREKWLPRICHVWGPHEGAHLFGGWERERTLDYVLTWESKLSLNSTRIDAFFLTTFRHLSFIQWSRLQI